MITVYDTGYTQTECFVTLLFAPSHFGHDVLTFFFVFWGFFAPLQLYIMKLFVMKQHISLLFFLPLFFHIFSTFCKPPFPFVSSILCALMSVIFLIPSSAVYFFSLASSLLVAVLSSCFPEHFSRMIDSRVGNTRYPMMSYIENFFFFVGSHKWKP